MSTNIKKDSNLPIIYLVDGSIGFTGAFVCARNIARALTGQAQVVLVLPTQSTISLEDTADFFAVYRLPIRNLRRNLGAMLAYLPALVIASVVLRWLMWRDRASVLIMNDFHLMHGVLCRVLCFRGRLFTWVRIDPRVFGVWPSRIWLWLMSLSSDCVVSVSRYIQELLPNNIHSELLYDALNPLPQNLAPTTISNRFVYIGNYIPGKGQDHAIEAFAGLAADHPNLTLYFYGSDMGLPRNRAYFLELVSRVSQLELESRVFLQGFASDTTSVLYGALAALNFSASESYSMTVLEAQGAGLPVITTRSGGPAEIVVDGETGILVPVGDVVAMRQAMAYLAMNKICAVEMGKAARGRVEHLFAPLAFRTAITKLLA